MCTTLSNYNIIYDIFSSLRMLNHTEEESNGPAWILSYSDYILRSTLISCSLSKINISFLQLVSSIKWFRVSSPWLKLLSTVQDRLFFHLWIAVSYTCRKIKQKSYEERNVIRKNKHRISRIINIYCNWEHIIFLPKHL